MQCPCGGETTDNQHEVKTSAKKTEWLGYDYPANPILVVQTKCSSCGRSLNSFKDALTMEILM